MKELCVYTYQNAAGNGLYEVVRYEPKTFRQRRRGEDGDYVYNLEGVDRVPYRLPHLIDAGNRIVFVVEGEKDADLLANEHNLVSTCNAGGAGNWQSSLGRYFRDLNVAILPDNDAPGKEHAYVVASSIYPYATTVRIVGIPGPEKSDISDWFNVGGTVTALRHLVWSSPPIGKKLVVERYRDASRLMEIVMRV
jgi:hypothetical protein